MAIPSPGFVSFPLKSKQKKMVIRCIATGLSSSTALPHNLKLGKLAVMSSIAIEMSSKSAETEKQPSLNWKYKYWLRAVMALTVMLITLVWILLPVVIAIFIYSLSSLDIYSVK